MAKTKTQAAQDRIALKKGAALQEREGRANLVAAVVATQTGVHFANGDLALGLMREAQTMSPVRKSKLIASGRAFRLSLVPVITGDATAIDLVARIPADLEDISEIAQQLVSLGLRSSRKRAGAPCIEFIGSSDEAAVRAVVEPLGGCVTVIASPTSAFEASGESHASEGALPADETGAATFVAGEPSVHGGIGSDAEERDATSIGQPPSSDPC